MNNVQRTIIGGRKKVSYNWHVDWVWCKQESVWASNKNYKKKTETMKKGMNLKQTQRQDGGGWKSNEEDSLKINKQKTMEGVVLK